MHVLKELWEKRGKMDVKIVVKKKIDAILFFAIIFHLFYNYFTAIFKKHIFAGYNNMLVKEIMTKNVVTIAADKSVYDASFLLRKHKIGSVLVEDNKGNFGIVTKQDIVEGTILKHKNAEETPLLEVMRTDLITIDPLENIQNAVELMEKHKIKKLYVVEDDKIEGVITFTDICKSIKDIVKRVMNLIIIEETRE